MPCILYFIQISHYYIFVFNLATLAIIISFSVTCFLINFILFILVDEGVIQSDAGNSMHSLSSASPSQDLHTSSRSIVNLPFDSSKSLSFLGSISKYLYSMLMKFLLLFSKHKRHVFDLAAKSFSSQQKEALKQFIAKNAKNLFLVGIETSKFIL